MFQRGQMVRVLKPKRYVVPRAGRLGRVAWLRAGTVGKVGLSRDGKTSVDFPGGTFGTWSLTFKDSELEAA